MFWANCRPAVLAMSNRVKFHEVAPAATLVTMEDGFVAGGGKRAFGEPGGESPTYVTNMTHSNLQRLPDYLLWDGPEAPAFGFLDGEWG